MKLEHVKIGQKVVITGNTKATYYSTDPISYHQPHFFKKGLLCKVIEQGILNPYQFLLEQHPRPRTTGLVSDRQWVHVDYFEPSIYDLKPLDSLKKTTLPFI